MSCRIRTALMVLLISAAGAGLCAEERTDALMGRIDSYLSECRERAHIPALSVTIVSPDGVLLSESYGEAESCDVPFVLGSVSKSFTALCVMRLCEQGKISLDQSISAYIPDAHDGESLTVRELLNHSGGLGTHQTLKDYRITEKKGVHTYANVNYTLLGKIIESASGMSYADYLEENVLAPLSFSHTSARPPDDGDKGLSPGHTNFWGLHARRRHRFPRSDGAWITAPAGRITSSTNDLGRYLQMYLRGGEGIVSGQGIETMFHGDTVRVDGDIPYWYGYGWAEVREPLPEPVLRHSGLVETGTSCLFILPERRLGIALAANVNDYFVTNGMMDALGWGVALLCMDEEPNEIPEAGYVLSHARADLVMLLLLALSVLPLCFFAPFRRRAEERKASCAAELCTVHAVLPVLVLLAVPVFFRTSLRVARDFVPDVYATVVVSSALLFLAGAKKAVILSRACRKRPDGGSPQE